MTTTTAAATAIMMISEREREAMVEKTPRISSVSVI